MNINPIDKIQLGKKYKSSPQASTELHAGGIFFCIPYEEILIFYEFGKVELTREVIEYFRPMDGDAEIAEFNNFKAVGTVQLSDRNYIECEFEEFTMIGLPLKKNEDILTFHCYGKINVVEAGKAYKLSV